MNVAITGATGFIGRSLTRHMLDLGHDVRAFLREQADTTGLPSNKQLNIVRSKIGVPSMEALIGCDVVVNLVGRAHTHTVFADGEDLFERVNHELTVEIARNAALAKVRLFIHVSTIGVHGNWAATPVNESTPANPQTPYAKSKWRAEESLRKLSADSEMRLCIVRPPLAYGPHCPGNFLKLAQLATSGLPLPLKSVTAIRSFIHVDNLSSFLARCACLEAPDRFSTFVIADGSNWLLPELLREMSAFLKKRCLLIPCPPQLLRTLALLAGKSREMESLTQAMQIDWSYARACTGWEPEISAQSALHSTLSPLSLQHH